MAGLECGEIVGGVGGGMELAEGGEEVVGEGLVEGKRGWELDEEGAEFGDWTRIEAGGLVEEGLEEGAGVVELGLA